MYFNGEPYGNHNTPHARKLPWEKKPKVINQPSTIIQLDEMMPYEGWLYQQSGYASKSLLNEVPAYVRGGGNYSPDPNGIRFANDMVPGTKYSEGGRDVDGRSLSLS